MMLVAHVPSRRPALLGSPGKCVIGSSSLALVMVTPAPAAVSTHHGDTEQGGTRAEAIPLVSHDDEHLLLTCD